MHTPRGGAVAGSSSRSALVLPYRHRHPGRWRGSCRHSRMSLEPRVLAPTRSAASGPPGGRLREAVRFEVTLQAGVTNGVGEHGRLSSVYTLVCVSDTAAACVGWRAWVLGCAITAGGGACVGVKVDGAGGGRTCRLKCRLERQICRQQKDQSAASTVSTVLIQGCRTCASEGRCAPGLRWLCHILYVPSVAGRGTQGGGGVLWGARPGNRGHIEREPASAVTCGALSRASSAGVIRDLKVTRYRSPPPTPRVGGVRSCLR